MLAMVTEVSADGMGDGGLAGPRATEEKLKFRALANVDPISESSQRLLAGALETSLA